MLENQLLREKTHGLVVENQELRQRLGMDALMTEEEAENRGNGARPVASSAESTAGAEPVITPPEHSRWILTVLTVQTLSLISCLTLSSTWTQSCSSDVLPQSLPDWSSSHKQTQKDPIPY